MTTKLEALLSEAADAATPEHTVRWLDQSGQGHGSLALTPRYGTFAVTGFTQTGNTTNTSTTVTNLDSSMRPRTGMTVSGTGIDPATTVVSVDRSANSMVISNAATADGTGVTLTFAGDAADPVLAVGYNCDSGGPEIVTGEGQTWIQFEGHFHRESDDKALMEVFFAYDVDGSGGQARPIFTWYDKVLKKPLSVDIAPGRDETFNIYFGNHSGDMGGGAAFEFEENIFKINAAPHQTAEGVSFSVGSHSGQQSFFKLSADGDNNDTKPTVQFTTLFAGGDPSPQHRLLDLQMSDVTAAKTGILRFRADGDIVGGDSIMMALGQSAGSSNALVHFSSENFAANYPTLKVTAKANQTRATLEIDGITNAGAAEARKYEIHPKGYVQVKPSAGALTGPTASAPGGGTSKYFPILDENGALYYVTGVPA